jgi:hypothetical protein
MAWRAGDGDRWLERGCHMNLNRLFFALAILVMGVALGLIFWNW